MNEKLLKKEYLKKVSNLQKYNQAYYDKSAPIIDDSDYDKLKRDIIDFETLFESHLIHLMSFFFSIRSNSNDDKNQLSKEYLHFLQLKLYLIII